MSGCSRRLERIVSQLTTSPPPPTSTLSCSAHGSSRSGSGSGGRSGGSTAGTSEALNGGGNANKTSLPRQSWPGSGYDDLVASNINFASLRGRTVFITGASRGIGLAIGLRCARDGANVVIAAKTADPHPKLPGTIHTAAEEIRKLGGKALAIECDVRSEDQIRAAVDKAVATFGGIDILVNNASAISLTQTDDTDMKRYDLMHHINTRGTFLTSKLCLPHLRKSSNAHILNISPPLNMREEWFAAHVAYTMAKYGMSMCVLGMSGELRSEGIAVNALWPVTTIATAAIQNVLGGDALINKSRLPEIMADAAHVILTSNSRKVTGGFFVDEYVLSSIGVKSFGHYAAVKGIPEAELALDFFV